MTYAIVATICRDTDISRRVAACVAIERVSPTPEQWVAENAWTLAAQPGWAAAWGSALASHAGDETYSPGSDESVITDGMILSAVQSITRAGEPDAVEGS